MDSCDAVKSDIAKCIEAQLKAVAQWHEVEPVDIPVDENVSESDFLLALVLAQHLINFRQWHIEDIARRKDIDATVLAKCKYDIDASNQRRTDAFERVDEYLVNRLRLFIPPLREGQRPRHNTESLGMVVDRLSILALKIFHMEEQTLRKDVDETHRNTCSDKLALLQEQHSDLLQSLLELVDDFCAGVKQPKTYYQMKMYNDPTLNPQLYGKQ